MTGAHAELVHVVARREPRTRRRASVSALPEKRDCAHQRIAFGVVTVISSTGGTYQGVMTRDICADCGKVLRWDLKP